MKGSGQKKKAFADVYTTLKPTFAFYFAPHKEQEKGGLL